MNYELEIRNTDEIRSTKHEIRNPSEWIHPGGQYLNSNFQNSKRV